MIRQFGCRKISRGAVEGEVLIFADPILFYQTDPATGVVIERGHCLYGKSVKDKILLFPGGKGSSVVQADGLYRLEQSGAKPLEFMIREPDTVLAATAIIMEIPMIDRVPENFYHHVRDRDMVRLDATAQTVTIR